MPEPATSPLRPTLMKRIMINRSVLALLCLLALAGCGSASEESATGSSEPAAAEVGACPEDSPAVVSARTLTRADLDGDGQDEAVKLTAADGDCPNLLFAKVGEGYVSAPRPASGPVVSAAYPIEVPGIDGALLVTRQDHPRGGFQLRLLAAEGTDLTELKADGRALVPFVALDVEEHPLSVDCTDGGVVLTEAVPHEPVGVAFAWDVQQTTYAIEGTAVTPARTREVADNVLPEQLKAKYPELVKHTAFTSCRADG